MDSWKSRGGKSQRGEEKKWRESEKKEDAGAQKVGSSESLCLPAICGSGGSKSRLAKAACVEPAGKMRDEKLHAVVARSTCRSQNLQSTPFSDNFWKLRRRKKCTPLWRKAHVEVNMCKTHQVRTTFGSWDVEKVHAVVARSTFPSQSAQSATCTDHFWRLRCGFAWQAQGIVHLVKSEQNVRGV